MIFLVITFIVLAIISLSGLAYAIWDIVQLLRWRKSLKPKSRQNNKA